MADDDGTPGGIDAIDRRILAELLTEPRLPIIELARRIGVVRGTAQTRLDRLVRRGIVSGRGIALDPAAVGHPITAFVSLQIRQGHGEQVRARLTAFTEVVEMHTTAGTFDLLCRVAARSNAALQATIDRLVDDPAILRSHTSIVLSTPLSYRIAPLLGPQ